MATKILTIILFGLMIIGCSTRTVYIKEYGEAIMLREEVKNVKVWVKTKDDEIIPAKANLHEGSFVLTLDEEDLRGLGLEYLIDLIKKETPK